MKALCRVAVLLALLLGTMTPAQGGTTYLTLPTSKLFSADKLKVPKPKTETLSTGVQLSWNPSVGAIGYRIYRGTKNNWKSSKKIAQTLSVEFLDKTAKPGVNYYYWICPVAWPKTIAVSQLYSIEASQKQLKKWLKKGTISKKASKFKKKCARGWKPVTLSAPDRNANTWKMPGYNESTEGIKVSWKKASGAVKYFVYRLEEEKMKKNYLSWKDAEYVGETTATSFLDTKAKAGYVYRYWVAPIGKNGKNFLQVIKDSKLRKPDVSSLYAKGMRKTTVVVPTPTISTLGPQHVGVSFEMAQDKYIKQYNVYRSRTLTIDPTRDASFVRSAGTRGPVTVDDYDLATGVQYYYYVVVVDIWGTAWSEPSKYATVTIPSSNLW